MKLLFKKLNLLIFFIQISTLLHSNVQLNKQNFFNDKEISNFIETEFKNINSQKTNLNQNNIVNTTDSIINNLKDFKISGMATTIDPNFAFIYDKQNPKFNVTYKNSKGEFKNLIYKAQIKSIGWKFELTFKLNFIFFTESDFNLFDAEKEIMLGYGIDFCTNFLDFTYVSFKNAPGGIIIVSLPIPQILAATSNILNIKSFTKILEERYDQLNKTIGTNYKMNKYVALKKILGLNLAIVTGGILTPENI